MSDARKITNVALDPRWSTAFVDLDGCKLICVTIEHPVHGVVDMIVPRASARKIGKTLTDMANES